MLMTLISLLAFLILIASWAILPATDAKPLEVESIELTPGELAA